ncbi:MAG TPA: hypothetical protein VFR43_09550 [Gaiellaceae bacterium]|nr:hypothetical protein [Gaiellaceae bacterium]
MGVPVSFVRDDGAAGSAIVVNFGVLTGREATQAEVDRLGRQLLRSLPHVSVSACRRHELADGHESIIDQVVVEGVDPAVAVDLVAVCDAWATDCAAERRLEPLDRPGH